ncbi:hypothetical protein PC128_g20059 [Phytophthora cactorum]|nr:hypothetical protein PC120_g21988 [Phytophthora cactorum]KAG3164849.1 hypothetical protein PC128_g20059 [Phytophthora cactorum]KAG4045044.1 hypothetical protein PC123_g19544 [Phytophthora cactorum]
MDMAIKDLNIATIYNVQDVIDVILVSSDPDAISVRPLAFKGFSDYNGANTSQTRIKNVVWCLDDLKAPIDTAKFDRDGGKGVLKLNSRINSSQNGWGEEDKSKMIRVNDRSNMFHDMQLANSKKNNYYWPNVASCKCTQFSVLYGDVDPISELGRYGYRFARPDQFTHRCNWLRYSAKNNDHDSHLIVMLLTVPNLLKQLRFSSNDEQTSSLRDTMENAQKLTSVKNMVQGLCGVMPNRVPDMAIFQKGTYYMGDSIYCANGRYRFFIQPDGNLVIYDLKTDTATWSTGTNSVKYMRPRVIIKDNGTFVITDQDGGNEKIIADMKLSNGGYLGLMNTGDLTIGDASTHKMVWIIRSIPKDGSKPVYTDYFNNNAFYFPYKSDNQTDTAIFSPNLAYKLHFQNDGNLVLYETLTGKAT